MATLNVKKFPDDLYQRLRRRASHQHRTVSQEVVHLLTRALAEQGDLDITDLAGLGAELWQELDPAEHVAGERDAWD